MIVGARAEVDDVHIVFAAFDVYFAAPAVILPEFYGLVTIRIGFCPADGVFLRLVRIARSGGTVFLIQDVSFRIVSFGILDILEECLHFRVGDEDEVPVLHLGSGVGEGVFLGRRHLALLLALLLSLFLSLLLPVVRIRLGAVSKQRKREQ